MYLSRSTRPPFRYLSLIDATKPAGSLFDLNRWGLLETSIQPQLDYLGLDFPAARTISHPVTGKPYFRYPIPGTEFVNNAKLGQQNPGYD